MIQRLQIQVQKFIYICFDCILKRQRQFHNKAKCRFIWSFGKKDGSNPWGLEHPKELESYSKIFEWICQVKGMRVGRQSTFQYFRGNFSILFDSKESAFFFFFFFFFFQLKHARVGLGEEMKQGWFTVLDCSSSFRDRFSSNKELNLKFTQVSVHLSFVKTEEVL